MINRRVQDIVDENSLRGQNFERSTLDKVYGSAKSLQPRHMGLLRKKKTLNLIKLEILKSELERRRLSTPFCYVLWFLGPMFLVFFSNFNVISSPLYYLGLNSNFLLMFLCLPFLFLYKFYLGRVGEGIFFLIGPILAIVAVPTGVGFFISDILSQTSSGGGGLFAIVGLVLILVCVVWWLIDVFILPFRVEKKNIEIELEIIGNL